MHRTLNSAHSGHLDVHVTGHASTGGTNRSGVRSGVAKRIAHRGPAGSAWSQSPDTGLAAATSTDPLGDTAKEAADRQVPPKRSGPVAETWTVELGGAPLTTRVNGSSCALS